ncbi:hypothetical protein DEDE109153_15330 [Deinococcus deserti]|uniref:Uncharacterized protein n=1 Tax=Deinococcus deserti (strain DSM 17065 / CIP 109153 / LMG 22923 / VCD115) TaxID=546414 RepID=X5H5T9_DEIDV|nr:hypothetical protein [Deinococcus deserti]AHX26548.1 hypothetical protein Deide_1p00695 [Deinococcus deserti VCD115]
MSRQERFLSVVVALNGLVLLLTGLTLAVVPEWFYTHLAPFAPFNRHFAGDAGIFSAALGGILLVAARQVRALGPVVVIGAAASLWHALNHMYDHWQISGSLSHLLDTNHAWKDLSLVLLAGLTLWTLTVSRSRKL